MPLAFTAAASTASNGQVCLFLARWGKWPAWISVLVRTLELNVATRFLLLGDELPEVFKESKGRYSKLVGWAASEAIELALGAQ